MTLSELQNIKQEDKVKVVATWPSYFDKIGTVKKLHVENEKIQSVLLDFGYPDNQEAPAANWFYYQEIDFLEVKDAPR